MDLIYMNGNMSDVGVLQDYEFDLAFGADENSFECKIPSDMHCCEAGYFLYIEGTEYGGIIDSLEVITETAEVIYYGRTWHGILQSKIIAPLQANEPSFPGITFKTTDSGGNSMIDRYLIISGDLNTCLRFLLHRASLDSLFAAPAYMANIPITNFQFDRYINGYNGIIKLLSSVGKKLHISYIDEKVLIEAVNRYDYASDGEFDSSLVQMQLKKRVNSVNHLVCLGSGELENRTVINLYADTHGNISTVQTQFGLEEYADKYDFPNVESPEELMTQGIEHLKKLWEEDSLVIKLDDNSDFFGIGDTVGAKDSVTGISASAVIQKIIVQIINNQISISYEVG